MITMSIEQAKELLNNKNCSVEQAKEALEVVKKHLSGEELLEYIELAMPLIYPEAMQVLVKDQKEDEYKDVSEETLNANADILSLQRRDNAEVEEVLAKVVLTDENGEEMDKEQAQPYILKLKDAAALQAKVSCITQKYDTPEAGKKDFFNTYRNNLLTMFSALKEGEKTPEALRTNTSIRFSAQSTLLPCAHVTATSHKKLAALKEKFPNNKVVQGLSGKLKDLHNKCKALYGKRYEIAHNVASGLAQNKWQTTLNLVGSLAVTGLTAATGAGLPVTLGYMLYSTVTSWIAPVLDKASSIRKKDTNKMGLWASIKKARQELKQDRKYKNKGWIGTGVNIIAGGLIGMSGPANVVAAPMVARLTRLVGSNTANTLEVVYCTKDLEEATTAEDKETAKTNLERAKTTLGIGLVASALTQLLPTITKGLENAGQEAVVDTDIPLTQAQDWASEYSPDMGIRKGQWDLLRHLYSKEDLDRMSNILTGNKGLLEQLGVETKEEALFKYQRLSAWTDVVDAKTGLSIPGATRHFFNDEMADLNQILHCGNVGSLSDEEIGAIREMFAKVRPDGSVEGIVGSSNARMIGGAITDKDCPQATDRFSFGEETVTPRDDDSEIITSNNNEAEVIYTVGVKLAEPAGENTPPGATLVKAASGSETTGIRGDRTAAASSAVRQRVSVGSKAGVRVIETSGR